MRSRALTQALVGSAVAGAGLLALAGPASATTTPAAVRAPSASSPTPSAAAAKCDAKPWAARIQGAPKGLSAGDRSGDYLWHDAHGLHLRVTHPGHARTVYTGVVSSSAPMRLNRVKLEKGDSVRLSASRRSFTFVFADYGRIDGVDFHTDCASTIAVSHLNAGSKALTPAHVYLGATKDHPGHIPFTVHRSAPKA